jgi:hypothetical protein
MNARSPSTRGTLRPADPFLHDSEAERARAALGSYAGMAHFAGTGPHDRNCGHCAFWDGLPSVKHAHCLMFKRLTDREGPKVPRHAASCKYFEAKEGEQR